MAVFVTLQFVLEDKELEQGWAGDEKELEGSIVARLDELIGDDGMPYVPGGLKVHVKSMPGI